MRLLLLLLPILLTACQPSANKKASALNELSTLKPVSPMDNDRLINTYKSSKDTRYILQMLAAYAEANDSMLHDAFRHAYFSTLENNKKHPRYDYLKNNLMVAVIKYDCKSKTPQCKQFLTITSGVWAINTLVKQDAILQNDVNKFFASNPRIGKIYVEEKTLFQNYGILSLVYAVEPQKLGDILMTYEHGGPLDMITVQKNLGMKK